MRFTHFPFLEVDMNVLQTDTLKHLDITGVTSLFSVSPMHGVECTRNLDEIISTLDDRAILELYEGGGDDIDRMIDGMLTDVYDTIYVIRKSQPRKMQYYRGSKSST